METKTDQSLRMLHGRQHSPSSKILHFHLCQDHPCPTWSVQLFRTVTRTLNRAAILTVWTTSERLKYNFSDWFAICVIGRQKSPNDTSEIVESDEAVRKVDVCDAVFVAFNVTKIAYMSLQIGRGAVIFVEWVKVGSRGQAAIGCITEGTWQGIYMKARVTLWRRTHWIWKPRLERGSRFFTWP